MLPSASHATLIALTGVAVFLLSCFGPLDWIRQRLMTRVALTLHEGSVDRVLAGSYHASLRRTRRGGGQPGYWDASFSARAKTLSMTLPRLHLVAMNRSTTYRQ